MNISASATPTTNTTYCERNTAHGSGRSIAPGLPDCAETTFDTMAATLPSKRMKLNDEKTIRASATRTGSSTVVFSASLCDLASLSFE